MIRIDRSGGIDHSKSNNSKERMFCHYCFLNHGLKFQDSACNGCHNFTMLSVSISDIVIIVIKNVDYRCIILDISKSEAINSLETLCLKIVGIHKKYCLKF